MKFMVRIEMKEIRAESYRAVQQIIERMGLVGEWTGVIQNTSYRHTSKRRQLIYLNEGLLEVEDTVDG